MEIKNKEVISGVYGLYFENNNNKYYIGKSYDILKRYSQHCKNLRCNVHHSKTLQNAYNKYGTYPTLYILYKGYGDILSELEIYYISEFDSFRNGYNQTGGGDGAGYGYTGSSAKFEEDDYLAAFFMLVKTNMSKKDIATELGVTEGIVTSISLGKSHQHLSTLYPEEYKVLLSKFGEYKTLHKHSKDIYIGIVTDLANTNNRLKDIASAWGVSDGVVEDISRGATHKYLKDIIPIEYAKMIDKKGIRRNMGHDRGKQYPPVISPEGIIYHIESNAKKFAEEHGLHPGHFGELLRGVAKSHLGWKLFIG